LIIDTDLPFNAYTHGDMYLIGKFLEDYEDEHYLNNCGDTIHDITEESSGIMVLTKPELESMIKKQATKTSN